MTTAKAYIQASFEAVKARNPHETEFLQAVEELFATLEPVFEAHASGDSPVPEGLMSAVFGKTRGNSFSGTAVEVPSSQWMIGMGSPQ